MKIGDTVIIHTKDSVFEGAVMPNETESLVIKLSNGYNIGIDKKKIKTIKVAKKYEPVKERGQKMKRNSSLPKIAILHTGGTIASKVDYKTGGVVARFEPEEILDMFPE